MMNSILYATAILGAVVSVILRAWVATKVKTDTDEWLHLGFAREVKKSGKWVTDFSARYVSPVQGPYPPLVHVLLSPLVGWATPAQIRLAYLGFDLLVAALVFLGATFFGFPPAAAVFAASLYLLTPLNAVEGTFLNARSPGLLFSTLVMAAGVMMVQTGELTWALLLATAVGLVALTHRMALQVLLANLVMSTAVLFLEDHAAAALAAASAAIAGMALAFVLTNGQYAKVIRFHRYLIELNVGKTRKIPNPLHVVLFVPWLLAGAYAVASGAFLQTNATGMLAVGVAVPGLFAFLWWFGDGARHIYYATPSLLVLLMPVWTNLPPILEALLAAIMIGCIGLQLRLFQRYTRARLTPDLEQCFDFLKNRPGLLLCLPTQPESFVWFTQNPILYCQSPNALETPERAARIMDEQLKQHPVRWVVIQKGNAFHLAAEARLPVAFSSGTYTIFESNGRKRIRLKTRKAA